MQGEIQKVELKHSKLTQTWNVLKKDETFHDMSAEVPKSTESALSRY